MTFEAYDEVYWLFPVELQSPLHEDQHHSSLYSPMLKVQSLLGTTALPIEGMWDDECSLVA